MPKAYCIILARGGSKGVVKKNLQHIGRKSILRRAVQLSLSVPEINTVCVSSDDPEILNEASGAGAVILKRPLHLSSDTASSELGIQHFIESFNFHENDIVVFQQCTSPFVLKKNISEAIRKIASKECDSCFSAVYNHGFLWRHETGCQNTVEGINHHWQKRERRQDREIEYLETGAFYVFTVGGFKMAGNRFHGRISPILTPEYCSLEIDTEIDLEFARALSNFLDDKIYQEDL